MPTESTYVTVRKLDENGDPTQENEVQIRIKKDEILFDELDRSGHQLPHGCLAGSCGACRIQIIEGSDLLGPPSAVEKDTISNLEKSYQEKYGKDYLKHKILRLSCRTKVRKQGEVIISSIK